MPNTCCFLLLKTMLSRKGLKGVLHVVRMLPRFLGIHLQSNVDYRIARSPLWAFEFRFREEGLRDGLSENTTCSEPTAALPESRHRPVRPPVLVPFLYTSNPSSLPFLACHCPLRAPLRSND